MLAGKYEWPFFYAEGANTFESAEDIEKYATAPAITDELAEWEAERAKEETVKKIKLPWFVDCHMHVFSPKASPLPVIWAQKGAKLLIPSWEKVEEQPNKTFLKWALHDYPEYASMTTEALGGRVLSESENVLKDRSLTELMGEPEERKRILIALGIDIEMAHYWGYEGKPVYQKDENGHPGYFSYEKPGRRKWERLSKSEAMKLVTFYKQIGSTQSIFSIHKGNLLTFLPFDPRHWLGNLSKSSLGIWQDTLNFLIQTSKNLAILNKFTAIGYKLYTALGFRPDDYKSHFVISRGKISQKKVLEAKIPDLKEFYSACESNCIPITCHCSHGGIFAHDFTLYYDYLYGGDDASDRDKKDFFYEYYVSPFAWERVLQDFPALYLCLAHFGGEEEWEADENIPMPWAEKCAEMAANPKYPNFYIDLAYFTFKEDSVKNKFKKLIEKYPKLKQKILFGTDWYLIGGEKAKFGKYETYFKRSLEALSEIDPELPVYSMVLNPKRFLNLENVAEKISNIFGPAYSGLLQLVKDKMSNRIEDYYI